MKKTDESTTVSEAAKPARKLRTVKVVDEAAKPARKLRTVKVVDEAAKPARKLHVKKAIESSVTAIAVDAATARQFLKSDERPSEPALGDEGDHVPAHMPRLVEVCAAGSYSTSYDAQRDFSGMWHRLDAAGPLPQLRKVGAPTKARKRRPHVHQNCQALYRRLGKVKRGK